MATEPLDFGFLSGRERYFIIRERLPRLHQYLWGIIICAEHVRSMGRFPLEPKLSDEAARLAASTVGEIVGNTLILEVAGIWEKSDPASFSVPTLCALIDHPEVETIVVEHFGKNPPQSVPFTKPIGKEAGFDPAFYARQCVRLARDIEKDERLRKVRNYRNKHAAHPILATREERKAKAPLAHPSEDEVYVLIQHAEDVVNALHAACYGFCFDYNTIRIGTALQCDALYSGLDYTGPKPHPQDSGSLPEDTPASESQ